MLFKYNTVLSFFNRFHEIQLCIVNCLDSSVVSVGPRAQQQSDDGDSSLIGVHPALSVASLLQTLPGLQGFSGTGGFGSWKGTGGSVGVVETFEAGRDIAVGDTGTVWDTAAGVTVGDTAVAAGTVEGTGTAAGIVGVAEEMRRSSLQRLGKP